jgi:hypothetical protein
MSVDNGVALQVDESVLYEKPKGEEQGNCDEWKHDEVLYGDPLEHEKTLPFLVLFFEDDNISLRVALIND